MLRKRNARSAETNATLNDESYQFEQVDDREQLRMLRENHLNALERYFVQINEAEVFEAFTMTELRVRKERMQKLFNDLESAHTLYRRCCMMASDDIFINTEANLLNVFAKMEELKRSEQTSRVQDDLNSTRAIGDRPDFTNFMASATVNSVFTKHDGSASHSGADGTSSTHR